MNKVRIAIAGAGSRGKDSYEPCALRYPQDMQIVAVADPCREKVEEMARLYGVPAENCFSSAEAMLQKPRLADMLFVCTGDALHVPHALAAMDKGYDILLEKPIAVDAAGCLKIQEKARETGRRVIVCHVLRYTPFYREIKRQIDSGRLGRISAVHAFENVGYYHYAHSYVRGNWRRADESSPMILSKSCHDLDILLWLTGKRCRRISSFGSLMEFRPERAPAGASTRCLDGHCQVKEGCPYDAEKIYLAPVLRGDCGWPANVVVNEPTADKVEAALRTGPYGRCVYACDNDVVDHQTVMMEMQDEIVVTFTMCAFSNRIHRQIKIMGTAGELEGDMDNHQIRIWNFGKKPEIIDISQIESDLSGHGGGDARMIREVLDLMQGRYADDGSMTTIDRSVESHLLAFAAEASRLDGGRCLSVEDYISSLTKHD